MTKPFDVIGIGAAIVDVLARVDEDFLRAHGLVKGTMTLISTAEAERLYAAMGTARAISGGSAANTIAGLAAMGNATAFIGITRDDQMGRLFAHDLRAVGVDFRGQPLPASLEGPATARCLVMVTPDAERTMATDLGVSGLLDPSRLDLTAIAAAKITYLEGYLWDTEMGKAAYRLAAQTARDHGGWVALSLSDRFCVARHRDSFRQLIDHQVDILFANADEIRELFEGEDDDRLIAALNRHVRWVVVTLGAEGANVWYRGECHHAPAARPRQLVDTTGAGDLFAAGFLHALLQGASPARAARLGNLIAAEAISHLGARPETDLKTLLGEW